jgi:hypothetical protein
MSWERRRKSQQTWKQDSVRSARSCARRIASIPAISPTGSRPQPTEGESPAWRQVQISTTSATNISMILRFQCRLSMSSGASRTCSTRPMPSAASARQAIALTDDLLRSTFLDMFGDPVANPHRWPVSSVSELCEGKQYGTAEKANDEHRGTPVLRMNNLTYTGDIDLKDLKWVELSASELGKLDLRDGDVLFNRVNSRELVGKTSVWQHGDGYTFAGYLIRLRMRRSVATGAYVAAAMNMSSIKRVLFAMAKPSINMANISGTDLDRLLIPVPPIKQQREYDALMRRIMDLRRRGVADAGDELFSSLVARSFPVRLASEGTSRASQPGSGSILRR